VNGAPTPIRLSAAGRRFGARVALDGVHFELAPGRIAGLVGPNGSGKTTLLKLLAGFLEPDAGEVRVFGLDPFRARAQVMRRTRFAFAPPALFASLTAREHLVHLARLGGGERPSVAELERTLETVGLEGRADEPVRSFSFGMRQRLALAQALLPRPELLVLDEPTDGLDPLAVLELREVLRRLRDEHGLAVLLSSHLLIEVDRLVDDMLVLAEGRAVFRGAPSELRRGGERLVIEAADAGLAEEALRARGLVPETNGDGRLALPIGVLELEDAARLLAEAGTRLVGFQVERPSLESALLARLRAAKGER
jgi:ABC-2 type transport system ATP-binding protein